MQLKTESGQPTDVINWEQVRDALSKLSENQEGFVTLEDEQRLIQTASDGLGLVVEKCEGSEVPLYRASRSGSERFALVEVEAMFQCWYARSSMPSGLQWSVEEKGGTRRSFYRLLWALPLVVGALVIYELAR
jgi:hypothetical protein